MFVSFFLYCLSFSLLRSLSLSLTLWEASCGAVRGGEGRRGARFKRSERASEREKRRARSGDLFFFFRPLLTTTAATATRKHSESSFLLALFFVVRFSSPPPPPLSKKGLLPPFSSSKIIFGFSRLSFALSPFRSFLVSLSPWEGLRPSPSFSRLAPFVSRKTVSQRETTAAYDGRRQGDWR